MRKLVCLCRNCRRLIIYCIDSQCVVRHRAQCRRAATGSVIGRVAGEYHRECHRGVPPGVSPGVPQGSATEKRNPDSAVIGQCHRGRGAGLLDISAGDESGFLYIQFSTLNQFSHIDRHAGGLSVFSQIFGVEQVAVADS